MRAALYQGGVKEQVAHSALDVVLGRATDYIEENKVPSIMKPAVSLLAHGLKDKIHHKINSWDDQEQIEKLERERAENGEGELGEQREEQEGGEYENHGENENNEEEHKEGWFEKIKDKITGNDEEHKRRKRSLDNYNEQPLNAHQSKFSKLITTAKNLLHLNRKRQPAMQPRAYDQQQQQQQVQQRRKRDVSKSSEEGKPDGAFDRTKSVLSKLSPSNLMGKLNQHLGNDNQSKQ